MFVHQLLGPPHQAAEWNAQSIRQRFANVDRRHSVSPLEHNNSCAGNTSLLGQARFGDLEPLALSEEYLSEQSAKFDWFRFHQRSSYQSRARWLGVIILTPLIDRDPVSCCNCGGAEPSFHQIPLSLLLSEPQRRPGFIRT